MGRLLGQVVVGSFVVLLLSGLYLEFFFDPSMAETVYDGPYDNLVGVPVSHAYDSALAISFEVRGGLFVRQLHNWAASLFIAALLARLVVGFFGGRVRRGVWVVGVGLLFVGVMAAFTGVLLPDDLLSGTSLRMISGYLLSIPVVGTWLHWMLFGGEFPGTEVIPRLHAAHLVLAAVIAVVAARRAVRVRPTAMVPVTAGVLAVMAATLQVNAIWAYGPANPAHVSGGSTSPWYFGWVDGAVRLWPAWEIRLGDYTIPAWFWPSMVFLPLSFLALGLYPYLEERFLPPRIRTALGVAVITFYVCLQLAAAIDILAFTWSLDSDAVFWAARIGVFVLPTVAYLVTHRLCLGLRLAERATPETGFIRRLPTGGFVDVHRSAPKQLSVTG